MGAPVSYQNRMELLQGTRDMLVLKALQRGPIKGYGIAQSIRLKAAEVLEVETGSIYPAPRRHKRQRRVKLDWKTTESNQRAKFCQITAKGKQQLESDHERWRPMVRAIGAMMEPEGKA